MAKDMKRALAAILLGACLFAFAPGQALALTVAPDADGEEAADFYAVLHEDGTLVFQKDASVEEGAQNFVGSLAGYPDERKVPWLAAADKILEVRFDETFAALKPQSTKYWFYGCTNMHMIDLANFDTSESDSMRAMFAYCSSLTELRGIEGFDTSSSTYFGSMFRECSSLTELDLSHFNAAHVEVLCFMFNGCSSLKSLSLAANGWNSPELHLMVHVWQGCTSLETLDLSGLDTSHVTGMTRDFDGCSSLRELNLSIDTSSLGNMAGMFDGCDALSTVVLGERFSFCGKDGAQGARKVDLPVGNWKSAATGAVFANTDVPLLTADTYTLTDEAVHGPVIEPEPEPAPGLGPEPEPEPAPTAPIGIAKAKVALAKSSAVYTGKMQKGTVKSVSLDGKALTEGVDYMVASAAKGKNVGSYPVIINGKGAYTGTAQATLNITKAQAKAQQTVKAKTYTAKSLKKGSRSFTAVKLTTDGKATWKVTKNTAGKRIAFKNGKVTVKKGTPKGAYQLKVSVSAKAGRNFKALSNRSFTIKIIVK